MNCTNCGNTMGEGNTFCPECGTAVTATEAQQPVQTEPVTQAPVQEPRYTQQPVTPNYYAQPEITEEQLPSKFKPMGAWSYFGHQLLFSIPLVGLILLIVYAVGGTENINKRNFARSYFISLLIGAIIGIIVLVLALILGIGMFATETASDIMYY